MNFTDRSHYESLFEKMKIKIEFKKPQKKKNRFNFSVHLV